MDRLKSLTAEEQTAEALESLGQHREDEGVEFRILGPPGCGKTTNLARQVRRAVDKFGENSVLVTSFSRTAAAQVAGKDLPIQADRVGTLHAHCFRALNRPKIAEANVDEWNAENPSMVISGARQSAAKLEEDAGAEQRAGGDGGNELLEAASRLRGLRTPVELWQPRIRYFWNKWVEYKEANDLLDFTDLIERCLLDTTMAPGAPRVIFADEAQDLSPMQAELVRRWGRWAEYFVVVGDDDQCIFQWSGASPEVLIDPPLPAERTIVLKQSYRVPAAVHAKAVSWIKHVERRQEKEYHPTAVQGKVVKLACGTWRNPADGIMKLAEEHLNQGDRIMFLASCAYQVQPLVDLLKEQGWPFQNQWRRAESRWNPIRLGKEGTAANRLLALLSAQPSDTGSQRPWTRREVAVWADWLRSEGVIRRGQKKALHEGDMLAPVSVEDLDKIFFPAALDELLNAFEGDRGSLMDWWMQRLEATAKTRCEFPVTVVKRHGTEGLIEEPRIEVGTIHSVKGGEADVVFLWPDLSQAGALEYMRRSGRDAAIRLFYVGMTRAKHTLYICPQQTADAVRI